MCSEGLITQPVTTHEAEGLQPVELRSGNGMEEIRQKKGDTIYRGYDPPLDRAQQNEQNHQL
jgi:hypothetical protein